MARAPRLSVVGVVVVIVAGVTDVTVHLSLHLATGRAGQLWA